MPTLDDTVHAFVGPPRILAEGAPGGPLRGLTVAVKDLIDVAGTVTGAGNPSFAATRAPATAHAPAVARLVASGATVVGKTITDELAYSLSGTNVHYGTPDNPAAPGRVPGGSSAGSAAAVAAGLVDLALGTDTGGSIRVPASYCGILGWRPTHGRVSTAGVVPLAASFDTVGLFARSIDALLAGAEALVDRDDDNDDGGPSVSDVVFVAELLDLVDGGVRASIEAGLAAPTEALGVTMDECACAFRTLQGREAWTTHGGWITETEPAMGPGIRQRFLAAAEVTDADVTRAQIVRDAVRRRIAAATAGGRILLGPAAAGAAPLIDEAGDRRAATRARTLALTGLAGLAGAPVVVLPRAEDEGFPVGIAALAAPGYDLTLLRWAAERLT